MYQNSRHFRHFSINHQKGKEGTLADQSRRPRSSQKKLEEWNQFLSRLETTLDPIPAGAKYLNGLVENSHRSDDEYFLMIHAQRCQDTKGFLQKAKAWQDTWNCFKAHHGIAMNGQTPAEKLKTKDPMIHPHLLQFPVLLLENPLQSTGLLLTSFLKQKHPST